jgi:RNA polymerase sigma-70 factor (ECF subfamily)
MAPVPDDDELMRCARDGDVAAFAQIYDRHAPIALAVAQRMLPAASEAQDLLHDVFIEAWQHVREYDPSRGSVRTWLLVRLRSRALDRLHKRAREAQAQRGTREARDDDANVDPRSLHPERKLAVQQALSALHDSVRGTLELTYFEGLTAHEIAQRMGVPEGTVRSRLARGLEALARVFAEETSGQHAE